MEKTEGRICELRDRTIEIIQSGKQKMNQLGKNMSRISVTCVATTEDLIIVSSGSQKERSKTARLGFPGGAVVENPPANAGDTGSSPGLGRSHMPQSN